MKKVSALDRIFLLITGLLAAYQIVIGVEGAPPLALWAYTSGFGVLLLAGLLLSIFGFELLDSPFLVVAATVIPLSLSLGLVWEFLPGWRLGYLLFVGLGLTAVALTRFIWPGKIATFTLAVTHGIAGLLIVALPISLSLDPAVAGGFALVGVGGSLIGIGGLLLSFLRAGKPILPQRTILALLPGLLLLTTAAFVAGFAFV